MFLVFGLFYLTYMPATMTGYLLYFVPSFKKHAYVRVVMMVTGRMVNFNSVINPLSYAFKSKSFRRAFSAIVRRQPLPRNETATFHEEFDTNVK